MTDFNPWNLLLNTINGYGQNNAAKNAQNNAANNAQNGGIVNQNAQVNNALNNALANIQNGISQQQTKPLNLIEITSQNTAMLEQLKMENEVVQKYLQNLLNMPKTFDKFVQEALNGNESYQFLKIFLQNMLNTKELALLLNQNSKDAMQKMMNVISESLKSTGANMEQMRDILSVLSAIHTSTSTLDSNALKELFLLYIPINCQIYKEDGDFSKVIEENGGIISQNALTILFQTKSFSNILIALNEDNNVILVELHANEDFPYTKFKTIITEISKQLSVNCICDYVHMKSVEDESKKQNFKIISNEFISLNILLIAYALIKTVFRIDDDLNK